MRDVVLKLRQQDRAVSCEDFERLARDADQKVSRAYCIPKRNLTARNPYEIADAHMSIVIVPTEVFFRIFWSDGNSFIDKTEASAANNKTVLLWRARSKEDSSHLYLGSSTVFESFSFNFTETGTGYALKFEYFDGKNWTRLTSEKHRLVDGTSNWSANGLVTFTRPLDWRPINDKNINGYCVRISSATAPTKRAVVNRVFRDLVERVSQYLEPRRLLTTRVHVVGPRLVTIGVNVNLALKPDAVQETVKKEVLNRLKQFLNLEVWPLGRNVYVSEIYRQLDRIPGVDYVTKITGKDIVTAHDVSDDRSIKQGNELVAIKLNPDELVKFSLEKSKIEFPLSSVEEKLKHEDS